MIPNMLSRARYGRTSVMALFVCFRPVAAALVLLVLAWSAPAWTQVRGPDGAPNPTASSVHEQQVLKEFSRAEGRIDIPDSKAAVLIQPEGRTWDYFHEVLLHRGAA